jgi:tetrahydrodipicolinate N-succinyltransferase
MKYAVEMGPGAVIYTPSFINIGSGIQKLTRGDTQTHTNSNVIS